MSRRASFIAILATLLIITSACSNKKSVNPLANVGSKQPDKVLFDKAMDAMKHNRFDVARLTLQTLINTYPDSEFIARAKLAVGDSWYAEGGTASLAQAEQEYRDFETFFPNMPEAAEAQLKIANIQYQQMEKADRDYTHAKRAEDEYRNLIMQYPDNPKLVQEGKERLLEVQEVLADREFNIGKFYFLRLSYPASIARLKTLVEKYPLYSRADEALFLLGQNYEGQIAQMRARVTCVKTSPQPGCVGEQIKANMIEELTKEAAGAYSQIITRYPVMERGDDAKKRLAALHQPIPRPTRAAVAQNRKEEESRRENSTLVALMNVLKKGPDVSMAAKVGDPTLVEPTPIAASKDSSATAMRAMGVAAGGEHGLTVEAGKGGTPGPNEPAPRSDAAVTPASNDPFAHTSNAPDPNELKPAATGNELKPSGPPDPNELTPAADTQAAASNTQPLPPPVQVNEIQPGQPAASGSNATAAAASSSSLASDQDVSSSKKKKKKGLKKVLVF
ncbi:MAG TPA: outer membrane protein assembly factor BamD [Candidatus Sulfotelmatobacter sp.]|jgi:outer membrane protein assembly factor BamD|nr:outer membrane protein assembly factor BamD [Candidatus Sulfotelmatobacter sp.]